MFLYFPPDSDKSHTFFAFEFMFVRPGTHTEAVAQAIEKGADINAVSPERGALSIAAFHGHREIVDLLLEKGADVNAKNKKGQTALTIAKKMKHADIVQILQTVGAKG